MEGVFFWKKEKKKANNQRPHFPFCLYENAQSFWEVVRTPHFPFICLSVMTLMFIIVCAKVGHLRHKSGCKHHAT